MSAPARLLSVRLQGFKSFADRTHVTFGPGISAVVGPNGSGKSNLADALRWALGEQGRALRSRKSEDVIWAGSERRPAVGLADVQLTLDNGDGLLPVEYAVVELGRRLYRSGENDYLLNRQRVRLKDLVDLLDAAHLAENAFLFIGQGMVDQALALRPEERRPLFEEVAGVRRHERRRRRAEEQLSESAANLARVDDILAELRPQARRLGQQAEQQANRLSAADELATAILLSAHARWHEAGTRAAASAAAGAASRQAVEAAMTELLGHEQAIGAAGGALAGQATLEAELRSDLDRRRAARAVLQLREAKHGSEVDGAGRERARIAEARDGAEAELAAARDTFAVPVAASPADLDAELATLDAEIATVASGAGAGPDDAAADGLSAVDAAAVRRLDAAKAQELGAARRRVADAERHAAGERSRAATATTRAEAATAARAGTARELAARVAVESAAADDRERAGQALAEAESTARAVADRAGTARATVGAVTARFDEAKRALEAAEGGAFSRAARARGGRPIADGLVVEPSLQAAVDAALAGLGQAQVLSRAAIVEVAAERGAAVAAEALGETEGRAGARVEAGGSTETLLDAVRVRGGGRLVDALRRDDAGAVTRLVRRIVWLPDASACLELQSTLPPGWLAVARDGSLVVGEAAVWIRPDGRGLNLQADVDRLTADVEVASEAATKAAQAHASAVATESQARTALAVARNAEGAATAARRRAEEVDRAAAVAAESATRDAAWLAAQATRLETEAARLRTALPADEDPTAAAPPTRDEAAQRRADDLQRRRRELIEELEAARASRRESERRRAQAEAATSHAERQLASAARAAADLAERESRLAMEREEIVRLLAAAEHDVAEADSALAGIVGASAGERERLHAAETSATAARERLRRAQERARLEEREEVEARLALDGLRDQLLVELAGLGETALRHLGATSPTTDAAAAPEGDGGDGDLDADALEQALAAASSAWLQAPPGAEPPPPGRLAGLRRRFHDLGAVNPFAAEEYAEVRARLDGLEAQRTDLEAAIEHTRDLIRELETMIGDQFRRTFEALASAFDARFQQLFGGGYARLALTDPQDLAATGVEIMARPPGKKAQALAMLSGGERALTAVALLFAMLEVRPVPFCVLDEVDAALDEANIGRFTEALRELARTTQCIVITHNRGTIEMADALYGVTVGEDSVSRVISLRLDEATALAERGAEPMGVRAGG
jgi:chromosome segregation protein